MSASFDDYPQRLPRKQGVSPTLVVLCLLSLLLAFVSILWQFWPFHRSGLDVNAEPRPITPRGELWDIEKSTIALYSEARKSVVHITRLGLQRDMYSLNVMKVPVGTGSGFLWDKDGHVVSNYHVIAGAAETEVTLSDGSTWKGRVVGSYPDKDIAVLVIDAPGNRLRPMPVGRSNDLQVGQMAFAIGNPFGLDQTLTSGIISALGREIETDKDRPPIRNVIQTDAAINPGNSGGPLLDSAGRLIGMNTAIYSPSGSSSGIGFAIPVDDINLYVPQIIREGKVTRPGLGVRVASDQLAQQFNAPGVLIMDVIPDSPAAKAGLQPTRRERGRIRLGDIITKFNGEPIEKATDLFAKLEKQQVGATVQLTIIRDNQELVVPVVLGPVE